MTSHRGLSSVVGTVFLIAVVMGSLSYVTYSLDMLGNFSETLIVEESRQNNKQNESFEITSVDVTDSAKLNTVIKNTGEVPLQITNLYIDEQDTDDVVQKITIDKTIAPGSSFDLLAEGIDVDIDPTKGYNLKMSTSRGTVESFFVNSGSAEPLYMSLRVLPSTVSQNFPVTLLFVVVNNMTTNNSLYNLTPVLEIDSSVGGASFLPAVPVSTPTEYPVVKPGDIATFEYELTVNGEDEQYLDVAVYLQNGYLIDSGHLQSINSTITIKDVETAISSGSSITSLGLQASDSIEGDLLYFHPATFGISTGWPSYTKQMDGTESFTGGTILETEDDPFLFVTANMSAATQTLLAGNWNASLQYHSDPVQLTLPDPTLAFFFECNDCPGAKQTSDYVGEVHWLYEFKAGDGMAMPDEYKYNKKGYLKEDGDNDLTWNPMGGPDNDGYYEFPMASWLTGQWDEDKNTLAKSGDPFYILGSAPDTDSLWVKINDPASDYMPLLFIGEKGGGNKDAYEISIGDEDDDTKDGQIVFRFEAKDGTETKCITDERYDNDNWQLITAVRAGDGSCEIWVNSTKTVVDLTQGSNTDIDDKVKDIAIGTSDFNKDGMQWLDAGVAMWMHWNSAELTSAQIEDLYYTNYGENATQIHMLIEHTDDIGTPYPTVGTLVDEIKFSLPFYDPSSRSFEAGQTLSAIFDKYICGAATACPVDEWVNSGHEDAKYKYSRYNVTGTSSLSSALVQGDRISVKFSIDNDEHNLPIDLWISDSDYNEVGLDDHNSFLQSPNVDPSWPTFSTVTSGQPTTLTIFNEGPEGIWLTFPGSRFVVSSSDGLVSYGAMPLATGAITIGATSYPLDIANDGPYIPDQTSAEVTFEKLCNPIATPPPTDPACVNIPADDYLGYIYLSGFDEEGASFIRTIALGNIHVK